VELDILKENNFLQFFGGKLLTTYVLRNTSMTGAKAIVLTLILLTWNIG